MARRTVFPPNRHHAILVGSFRGLVATEYGRVLMLKIGLFAVMLVLAAINRFRLTPQLALPGNERRSVALRQLTRNSAIETACGLGILAIVGALAVRLFLAGKKVAHIAKELGIRRGSVYRALDAEGLA